jgi:hypothetical protein
VHQQVVNVQLPPPQDRLYDRQVFLDVLLDETQDRLPVVLGDVLCLVLIVGLVLVLVPAPFLMSSHANFNTGGAVGVVLLELDEGVGVGGVVGPGFGGGGGAGGGGGGLVDEEAVDGECLREGAFVLFDLVDERLQ